MMLILALALATAPPPPAYASAVDAIAAEVLRTMHVPGLAIGIVTKNGTYIRGYGVRVAGKPGAVTAHTLFQVGSVTKMFTAAALMRAAAERRFSLDTPVSKVIENLPACAGALTANELLSDGGGLKDIPGEDGSHDPAGLKNFTNAWDSSYCIESPGLSFSYSNPGFALAGRVLAQITHTSYAAAMQRYAFAPFGMRAATFDPRLARSREHALGHIVLAGTAKTVDPPVYDTRLLPAGYMYDNAADLVAFVTNTLSGGAGTALMRPQIRVPNLFDDASYAYGLFVRHDGPTLVVEHAGSVTGFGALVRLLPQEHAGIVVLSNVETIPLPAIVDRIDHAVTGRNATQGGVVDASHLTPVRAEDAQSLAGTYENRLSATISATGSGDAHISIFGGTFAFAHLSGDQYYALPHGPRFSIVHDGRRQLLQVALWSLLRVP